MKQPDLSIIIPAYCEERRIGQTLVELAAFLKNDSYFKGKAVEMLVVAADAPDNTKDTAHSKGMLFKRFQLLEPGERVGKGRDVQFGVTCAAGRFVVFMDADLATPLSHLRELYEACLGGYDVAIGTRNLLTYRHNIARGLFARAGNLLYRLCGGANVEDTQCGFKMFSAQAAKVCFGKLTILDWGFDLEVLAIAQSNKLRIKAFRIDDWRDEAYSTHDESVGHIMWRTVKQFVYISFRRMAGKYNW